MFCLPAHSAYVKFEFHISGHTMSLFAHGDLRPASPFSPSSAAPPRFGSARLNPTFGLQLEQPRSKHSECKAETPRRALFAFYRRSAKIAAERWHWSTRATGTTSSDNLRPAQLLFSVPCGKCSHSAPQLCKMQICCHRDATQVISRASWIRAHTVDSCEWV